jgi:hypothetical protein
MEKFVAALKKFVASLKKGASLKMFVSLLKSL